MNRFVVVLLACGWLMGCGGDGGGGGNPPGTPVNVGGNQNGGELNAVISALGNSFPHGDHVEFDLLLSTGNIYSAEWALVQAPAGSAGSMGAIGGDASQIRVLADLPGNYTLQLTVYDPSGRSDSATFSFTAYNTPPHAYMQQEWVDTYSNVTLMPIRFNADYSSDGNGDTLGYTWEVVSAPTGSDAAFAEDGGVSAEFIPDREGQYRVKLTVSDGWDSASDERTVYVQENQPPRIVLRQLPALLDDSAVTLDLSDSSDPDGLPLQLEWELISRPAGASSTLDVDGDTAVLTPSVLGDHGVRVVASDGALTSERVYEIVAVEKFADLPDDITDAEYDKVNDRIVLGSANRLELVLFDVETADVSRISLDDAPLVISVSPDGTQAAVGHETSVTLVDLAGESVLGAYPTSVIRISDVVHGGNGYFYVFPKHDQHESIRSIEIATGNETTTSGIYAGVLARKQPGTSAVYGADNGLHPSDIERYETSGGTISIVRDSPYHGDYAMCGNLWFSEDGSLILTACGNTFTASAASSVDMLFSGRLEENNGSAHHANQVNFLITSADHSADASTIATIERVKVGDYWGEDYNYTVRTYDDVSLELQREAGVPAYNDAGRKRTLVPRFVFHQPGSGKQLVLMDIFGAGTAQSAVLRY